MSSNAQTGLGDITGPDSWSYHAEAGVSPHKRRDTHGYGLKVRKGRGWEGEEELGCYYTT